MLTDYDIQRLSSAIVKNLVNNDKFIRRMARMMPKKQNMLTSSQTAKVLGVSRKTVCKIAPLLGGVKGDGKQKKWMFPEEGLMDRFIKYRQGL